MRAGEVIEGLDIAHTRRADVPHHRLAQGPGNLGKVLDLHRRHNGAPITGPEFILTEQPTRQDEQILVGKRIGLTKNALAPLRFWLAGNATVSSPNSIRVGMPFPLDGSPEQL